MTGPVGVDRAGAQEKTRSDGLRGAKKWLEESSWEAPLVRGVDVDVVGVYACVGSLLAGRRDLPSCQWRGEDWYWLKARKDEIVVAGRVARKQRTTTQIREQSDGRTDGQTNSRSQEV